MNLRFSQSEQHPSKYVLRRRSGKALRTGFTLIELLVVIAIISLLVSILLPSLAKARDLAKAVVCMNNEKSIGMANQFYAEDWEDHFVPAINDITIPGVYGGVAEAHTILYEFDYLKDINAWICPSAQSDPAWLTSGVIGSYARKGGYGVNKSHIHCNNTGVWTYPAVPMRRDQLNRGGEVLSFLDVRTSDNSHEFGWPWYAFCPGCWNPATLPGSISDRHLGNTNVLYADAHVAPVKFDDILNNEKDIWGHDSQ